MDDAEGVGSAQIGYARIGFCMTTEIMGLIMENHLRPRDDYLFVALTCRGWWHVVPRDIQRNLKTSFARISNVDAIVHFEFEPKSPEWNEVAVVAGRRGDTQMLRYLLHRCNWKLCDGVYAAAYEGGNVDFIRCLQLIRVHQGPRDEGYHLICIKSGHVAALDTLPPRLKNGEALTLAAAEGNVQAVQDLLHWVSAIDPEWDNFNAMEAAVREGENQVEIMKMLLDAYHLHPEEVVELREAAQELGSSEMMALFPE